MVAPKNMSNRNKHRTIFVDADAFIAFTKQDDSNHEQAKQIFKKLSQTEALFEQENKHIFNEFGIDLRKNGMYDEAIGNYEKAISIDPKDENLYYNLGRAYKETGDYKTAYEKVKKALELKPDFKEAQEYLEFLKTKK